MTSTEPTGFDNEATGTFAVPLWVKGPAETGVPTESPGYAPGPNLVYHSQGGVRIILDRVQVTDERERALAVALLHHAIRVQIGEIR